MNYKAKCFFLIFLLFHFILSAGTLLKIRSSKSPVKQRVVFDVEGKVKYDVKKADNQILIEMSDCSISKKLLKHKLKGVFINNFEVFGEGGEVQVLLNLNKNFTSSTFNLKNSVVDQKRKVRGTKIVIDIKNKVNKKRGTKKLAIIKKKKKPVKKIEPASDLEISYDSLVNLFKYMKYKDAVVVADSLILKNPGNSIIRYIRADSKFNLSIAEKDRMKKKKLLESSIADIEKVLTDSADFSKARLVAANAYKLAGDSINAQFHYEKFISGVKGTSDKEAEKEEDTEESGESFIDKIMNNFLLKTFLIVFLSIFIIMIIILIIIRRKVNKLEEEEIEDENLEDDESEREEVLNNDILSEDDFSSNDDIKEEEEPKAPQQKSVILIEDEGLNSYDSFDEVSISFDDANIKDRVIELHSEGYTNREISEELEISMDEVDFVVRSAGLDDNKPDSFVEELQDEYKQEEPVQEDVTVQETPQAKVEPEPQVQAKTVKKQTTEPSKNQSGSGDIIEVIASLYKSGKNIDDIAREFGRDTDEIEYILSIASVEISENEYEDEDEVDNVEKIKEYAKKGKSKKEVAQLLSIGLDEIEFAASLYDINFVKKSIDTDSILTEEAINEIAPDNLEESAREMDDIISGIRNDEVPEAEEDKGAILEEPEDDENDKYKKISTLAEQGLSKQDISSQMSMSLDELEFAASLYNIKFKEDAEKEPEQPVEMTDTLDEELNNALNEVENLEDITDMSTPETDDFFEEKPELPKEERVQEQIQDINNMMNRLDNSSFESERQDTAEIVESILPKEEEVSYNKEFSDIDSEDNELKVMRQIYEYLDRGIPVDKIAASLGVSIDDVEMYKKIKDSDL